MSAHRWLIAALVTLIAAVPVSAQTSAWTAWLYNPNGTITHLSSVGQVLDELTLPTAAGHSYPARVAVSRSGQLVAYVTTNAALKARRLVLANLTNGQVISDYVSTDLIGTSLDRFTTPLAFDETETHFAYGIAPQDGIWRIEALTVNTGAPMAELRGDDPKAAALKIADGTGRVPVIRAYQGGEIAFVMQQMSDPPGADDGSYLWNPQTGVLSANTAYPGLDNDLLPATGEIVLSAHDSALPSSDAAFASFGGQRNALDAIQPATGAPFPFYTSPDHSLAAPRFIQNGERILAAVVDSTGAATWRVIERSGHVVGDAALQIADLFPLANGFIYMTTSSPSTLMVDDTRASINAGTPVGQGEPNTVIQLAWAADSGPVPSPTYADWINLDDVVSVAHATQTALTGGTPGPTAAAVTEPAFYVAPTPVFLPTRESFASRLKIGQRAVVTTAGNQTGLHVDPSMDSPALILLFTNMDLDVIDGPNITDGYIWWKVQVVVEGHTRTGWAVEGANGVTWLAPAP